jgi:hypothetical protein
VSLSYVPIFEHPHLYRAAVAFLELPGELNFGVAHIIAVNKTTHESNDKYRVGIALV